MEIKFKQVHCGQYKRYGDFFRIWELETEIQDKEQVLNYCFENLYERKLPAEHEWRKKIQNGQEKFGDADYYFAGYYNISKINKGWKFTVCEPYCD